MNRGLRRVLIGLLATIPALGGAQEANPGVLAPYAQDLVVLQSKGDGDAAEILKQLQERLKGKP